MPRKRRQARIPTPVWESPHGALGRRFMGRRPRFYATVSIVVLVFVALGIVGFGYWSDYWAERQRPGSTAVQVEDTEYSLRYFSDRLRIFVQQVGWPANQAAQAIPAVADLLVDETILLRFAAEMGVSATENEIKDQIAARLDMTADDPDLDTRFQEELALTGLTEEEYKQMIEAAILRNKMLEKLEAEEVPTSAESVHYRLILVSDQATADEIVRQVEEGADFGELAAELSLDTTTKADGGDAGWIPRGILQQAAEEVLFALEPGELATFPVGSGVVVFQVVEKAADREIEPDQKTRLAEVKLQDWLGERRAQLEVRELVSQDEDKARWAIERAFGVT